MVDLSDVERGIDAWNRLKALDDSIGERMAAAIGQRCLSKQRVNCLCHSDNTRHGPEKTRELVSAVWDKIEAERLVLATAYKILTGKNYPGVGP